jgi:O-antigen/teichoic acid export membrane protein
LSLVKRLSISSSIYTATTILRQGIYVLLLPLYTHLLSPSDFGILAVVNSVGSFLSILFCLGLNASITRFYFEYRDDQDKLKIFLSTTLTFLLFSSTSFGIILLIFGEILLSPVTGDIPFWPFIALIILIQIFQPFFTIYLSLLQTIEKPGLYAIFALFEFTLSLVLVIFFVTFMNWGVQGVLIGRLVIAGIFFIISFYALKNQIQFVINRFYIKQSLCYCIPIVPHSIAAHIYSITDKIALNSLMGTSIVGLYNVGYVIGGFMSIVTNSTNRAYMPIYTDILTSKRQQRYQNLKNTGILLVVFYCWTGSMISIFSKEIIMLMTNNAYSKSFTVVPFIA